MTVTYEAIASQSVTSVSLVDFTSIPSTYTDLFIAWTATSSANTGYKLQFNSDTATNYSVTYIYGDGSTAVSGRDPNINGLAGMGRTGTSQGVGRVNVMNYSNTTTYKTVLGRGDLASQLTMATVGLWRSTSAINAIRIAPESGTITAGTFSLYGIKAE
jgi:hypothetical protein